MKPAISFSLIICLVLLFFSCTVGPQVRDGTVITTNPDANGNKITLRFTRGSEFSNVKRFLFIKAIITPQIAVWVEDTLGNYLKTIYVTRKFAKQEWGIARHSPDSCFRTSSLPYWLNKYTAAGNAAPTKNKPLPDAVTAATPPGSFDIVSTLASLPLAFFIKVEINKSFDANKVFNEKREESKINGQPAVVYAGRVNGYSFVNPVIRMEMIGRSGEKGTDPRLYPDTVGLTTATRIFDCINILLNPADFQASDSLIRTGATQTWTWDMAYRKKPDTSAKK